ncbi:MAG: WS/DGAT/MGAT family O-acyltransferase [Usitatibacter sp.]
MTNRERISGVDTAWLRMDQPTSLMMIVGVMMLERKARLADLKAVIESRFLSFRRFRQRAVQDVAGAWWETDEAFDIDAHVQRATLPGKGGKAQLEALVSRLASTALDFSRPLWHFTLVDNYDGGCALITRIHHCYADGIALMQVMLSLTDATAEGSLAPPAEEIEEPQSPVEADLWQQILKPVTGALDGAAQLGIKGLATKGLDFAGEVAKLITMDRDSESRFKGALGLRKRAAWAEPLPLDEVKVVGKALGSSINDVLLSMATGAMRDYLLGKGDPVAGLEIRAIVPVNLRSDGEGRNLGNHFGLVFLDLPIGMEHPLQRLHEIRRRMRALRGSYQPIIALGLLNAVGYGPKVLQEQVTNLLGNNASAVITNVPGPPNPLYIAGQHITELDFWVPQSGGIGMGISILSYNGRIQFGVITDAGLVPDPHRIVGRFAEEFDKLMWIALMSPWGEEPMQEAETTASAAAVAPAKAGAQSHKVPKRFRNL